MKAALAQRQVALPCVALLAAIVAVSPLVAQRLYRISVS